MTSLLDVAVAVTFACSSITGGVVSGTVVSSITVTLKVCVPVLPPLSAAVHVTAVVPIGKTESEVTTVLYCTPQTGWPPNGGNSSIGYRGWLIVQNASRSEGKPASLSETTGGNATVVPPGLVEVAVISAWVMTGAA